jgi:hypothetical protein
MEAEPRLGSCSGKPWYVARGGALRAEPCGDEISVGMTKFYRVECFREIGGFVRQVLWDGIDCHRSRMLGWRTRACDDEALRFVHLRPMGSSHKGIHTGRVRGGFGQWFMGTSPLFALVSAAYRLPAKPAVTGSLAFLWGYFGSALRGVPRYDDLEFRRFLRRYQRASLLLGKRRAVAQLEAEGEPAWRARHAAAPGKTP